MRVLSEEETDLVSGGRYASFAPVDNAQLIDAIERARSPARSPALVQRLLQRAGGKLDVPRFLLR